VLVPQASAYVAMPLAASGFLREALHSWGHPHANPAGHARHLSRESERGFAQVFGSRGRYQASGQERAYRPDFSTRQYGAQFGLPVHRYRTANGVTQIDLGAGAGDAGFTIDAPFSQSHSRIRIGGLGLRVANTHSSGAYATALLKIDHLGIDVRTQERNEVASFGGIGISALCEAGGAAAFGNGWTVESSVRASYVEVRLRNFIDADQVSVKPQPFRSASAGIASRVSRSFTAAGLAMRPYVGAGLAYTSGPPSSQRIGGVPFASETMSSSWEASAGFEGRLGKNARLLVDVAVQDGLDHGFSSVFATGAVHWAF
jgi:outer membrane autotransporter protein